MDDCRNPASRGQWQVVSTTCWACLVLEADRDARTESGSKQRGLYIGTIRAEAP